MENEVWKDIPTYNGKYQASDLGRIKSFKGKTERILKQGIQTQGYCIVDLEGKSKRVHSLILLTFKNIIPTGTTNDFVIDHLDDNKQNNRLDNLSIKSHRDNIIKNTNPSGARLDKRTNKWLSKIKHSGKVIYLGSFSTKEEAELRYKEEVKKLY